MPLDLPRGTRCFIDANIFAYHLVETPELSEACSSFFERGELVGVTSATAVAEASHRVMLAEALAKHKLPHQGLAHRLQRRSQLLTGLSHHFEVARTVRALQLEVEPLTLELLEAAASLGRTWASHQRRGDAGGDAAKRAS